MQSQWDIFGQAEKPSIILCNPDKTELFSLGAAYNIVVKLKFNALSELTFDFPETDILHNLPIESYQFIVAKRLILIENVGYFLISKYDENLSGMVNAKSVTCESLEAELVYKKLTVFGGTFQFYNPISPQNTLLGQIVQLLPNWSIGTIDGSLLPLFRTFNITDKTIYDFLMNEVATAYQCVFSFDTFNRTISAYTTTNATTNTDIFLSFDNLLNSGKLSQMTDELVTALHVYGDGTLDIHAVNPLGTNIIYNFDYYKTTDWMSQGLIDAINLWEANIATQQPIFANLLTQLEDANNQLLSLQINGIELQSQMDSLIGIQKTRIQQGLSYADINTQIAAQQLLIDANNANITSENVTIQNIQSNIVSINNSLQFSNAFTQPQLLELNNFIIENTYQNKNFVITDTMTNADIQNQAQSLYDQAIFVLQKVSQPRYEFSIDTGNFLFLKKFQPFIDQLQLGCVVTVDKGDQTYLEIVLLEIDFQYDDSTKFTLTMSNPVRLNKKGFVYSDLFNQAVTAGTNANFNSNLWSDWVVNSKNDVTNFINSALNATTNNIISSNNQEIVINQNGLRGKTIDPNTHVVSPNQVWLINNMLAFTQDNWQTASLALGQITVNNQTTFGLVADVLVGRILAGNELTIQNQNNTFTVDGNGATLVNATLSVIGNGARNKILLDPTNGIKVQALVNNQFVDKFYVDNSGNVTFAGILNGASGNFTGTITANAGVLGGWTINSTGLSDTHGNFINSNGNFKIGALTITGSNADFNGTIHATNLSGQIIGQQIANNTITDPNIGSLNAGKMVAGSMLGNRIFGGTMGFNGASMGQGSGSGSLNIDANNTVNFTSSGGNFTIGGSLGFITTGSGKVTGVLYASGGININGNSGQTVSIPVGPGYSNKQFNFTSGVLTSWQYI